MNKSKNKLFSPNKSIIQISENKFQIRYLHLNNRALVHGAMYVANPALLILEYTRRMMAWLLLRPESDDPSPNAWSAVKILHLGLGAGGLTRYCLRTLGAHNTAVELSREVIEAGHSWFMLPRVSPNLHIEHADAAIYVANPVHANSADVIFVDIYDQVSDRPLFDTPDFYRCCFNILRPNGVLSVNIFGQHASIANSSLALKQSFSEQNILRLQATPEGNTILLAWKDFAWPEPEVLCKRAQLIELRYGLNASIWLQMIKHMNESGF